MRWTRGFFPTMKEIPAEAEMVSHKLMLRAGLIKKLSAGSYSYLPLGWRALRKATEIVRAEMDRAGAVELLMPALHPLDLWKETGRDEILGDVLLRITDRHGRENCLGPTHEEVITDIVRNVLQSYKQLPINLYQIQTKFRDEPRPRSGVMRSREFLMKDAYSFDPDETSLAASYDLMFAAYKRIFALCGVKTTAVEADSGAIGGAVSTEFMALCDAGEDKIASCGKCGYAANTERCECLAPEAGKDEEASELQEVATPGAGSIEQVAGFLKCSPKKLVKTLIYTVSSKDGSQRQIVVLVRGDHEVNEIKLAKLFSGQSVELATEEAIKKTTGAPIGFAGPLGLELDLFVDGAVAVMHNFVVGANKADAHLCGVNWERDLDLPRQRYDLRVARSGDPCPKCQGKLALVPGIELGHVFQLGTKYSEAMNASYLGEDGKARPLLMGCYGIGVNRILAGAIELHHDKDGIIWPVSIAPYDVEVVAASPKEEGIQVAENIYQELQAAGLEVLLDDRTDVRPGVKFKDADLIGLPVRVVVGDRGLKEGVVEVVRRSDKDMQKVGPEQVSELVIKMLQTMKAELQTDAENA
jgi:prolyl-tRNA synthetase